MIDNDHIKRVAIDMCDDLGINPFEIVSCADGDTDTPFEYARRFTGTCSSMSWSVPRWELWRHKAAVAIASYNACQKNTPAN